MSKNLYLEIYYLAEGWIEISAYRFKKLLLHLILPLSNKNVLIFQEEIYSTFSFDLINREMRQYGNLQIK